MVWALTTVTRGEMAKSVRVPEKMDFSQVVKVEVRELGGAVAPGPELDLEP
jgi:virulence-associated protein VagC